MSSVLSRPAFLFVLLYLATVLVVGLGVILIAALESWHRTRSASPVIVMVDSDDLGSPVLSSGV